MSKSQKYQCPGCNGSGRISAPFGPMTVIGGPPQTQSCSVCRGRGWITLVPYKKPKPKDNEFHTSVKFSAEQVEDMINNIDKEATP